MSRQKRVVAYPQLYCPKPPLEQVEILVAEFGLSIDPEPARHFIREVLPNCRMPKGAEAAFCTIRRDFNGPANKGIQRIFSAIATQRSDKCVNYCDETNNPVPFEENPRTSMMMDRLEEQQPGDIQILFAQFGVLHVGESVMEVEARIQQRDRGEFCLGILPAGCMILTHPERFENSSGLNVECAGNFLPKSGSHRDQVPYFFMHQHPTKGPGSGLEDKFGIEAASMDFGLPNYGVVTGFVPSLVKPSSE